MQLPDHCTNNFDCKKKFEVEYRGRSDCIDGCICIGMKREKKDKSLMRVRLSWDGWLISPLTSVLWCLSGGGSNENLKSRIASNY